MIAYFILIHRYPNQFKRLFKSIYSEKNHYVVHIDKRAGKNIFNEISIFLQNYQNTSVLESKEAIWGYAPISSKSPKFAHCPVISRATDDILYDSINTRCYYIEKL